MAITLDFGKCAACGQSNSKTLPVCRACGASLPWAKTAKKPSQSAASPTTSRPKIGLGDIAWGAMSVQLLGGFLFVLGGLMWIGDTLTFISTFAYADKITMAIGGALWAYGQNLE